MSKHYFECKKLDNRMVIVYDYRLNQCYNAGDDLVLRYKNREMTVPHAELKQRAKKLSNIKYQSHFGGEQYGVYHFKWQPDPERDPSEDQMVLPFPELQATPKDNT